ncbi:MAG: hypothetical protein US12_C0019G0006 [Parcubacteria group bacterium GW2011_GWA2_36_24]|nr:MAG: hypothetical protein US12_C0019G0006 [Parcubacteria group bacterium GW2011_GWA2_36_24]
MSYLLDKKIKRKKFFYLAVFLLVFLILFYFRSSIWNGFSSVSHRLFRPILILGNNLGGKLGNVSSYFAFKNSLYLENENLKSKLNESEAQMSNYNSVLAENINLKEILGRKDEKVVMILSAILSKPNRSPYDTLIIDVGIKQGIEIGDLVFAFGNIPIGQVEASYVNSSKVILFSDSKKKTQVVVGDKNLPAGRQGIFMEIMGRGGGNFEMILPRDFTLIKGDQVVLPGITPYVLGIVETIISDPRDSFVKALLTSPVNIQELKFVEIKTN